MSTSTARSWDYLVREWLASGLADATLMHDAIRLLETTHGAPASPISDVLEQLLADPMHRLEQGPRIDVALEHREQLTLQICLLFPFALMADMIPRSPIGIRGELGKVVLTSVEDLAAMASQLGDRQLKAAVCSLGCTGARHAGTVEEAVRLGSIAVETYRALASKQQKWSAFLAMATNSLGAALLDSKDLGSAMTEFADAVWLYEDLCRKEGDKHAADLAMARYNLGRTQILAEDFDRAIKNTTLAAEHYSLRVDTEPDRYTLPLACSMRDLSICHRMTSDPVSGLNSARKASRVLASLAQDRPDIFGSDRALALHQMSLCLKAAGRAREARLMGRMVAAYYSELVERHAVPDHADAGSAYDFYASCCSVGGLDQPAMEAYKIAHHYFSILGDTTQPKSREEYASSLHNYSILLERQGRFEDAIYPAQQSVEIYAELAASGNLEDSRELANAANGLSARCYRLKRIEDAARYSRLAVGILRKAHDQSSNPWNLDLSNSLSNYSIYLSKLGKMKGALVTIEEATKISRRLSEDAPERFLPLHARNLSNLTLRLQECAKIEDARVIGHQAVDAYRRLHEQDAKSFAYFLACSLSNLALMFAAVGDEESATKSVEEAAELDLRSSESWSLSLLEDRISFQYNLALDLMRRRKFADLMRARDALRAALAMVETQRGAFRASGQKRRIQEQAKKLSHWRIVLCLAAWARERDPKALQEILETAEEARARVLNDQLSDTTTYPLECDPREIDHFRSLRKKLAELEDQVAQRSKEGIAPARTAVTSNSRLRLSAPDPLHEAVKEPSHHRITQLRAALDDVRGKLARKHPNWSPEPPASAASFQEICDAIPSRSALLHFSLLPDRLLVLLVLPNGQVTPLDHHGFDCSALEKGGQLWQEHCQSFASSQGSLADFQSALRQLIDGLSAKLLKLIIDPLRALRSNVDHLIICPSGALHLYPIHACQVEPGVPLENWFSVSYCYSASLLSILTRRPPTSPGPRCAFGNPTGDLPFSELETTSQTDQTPPCIVRTGPQATRTALLEQLSRCESLFYSGHSIFERTSPEHSGLRLHDGKLTIAHLVREDLLAGCKIAFLNGCESGFLQPNSTDDFLSLPAAFLQSGARSVISTLWPINDLSAALLGMRLQDLINEDKDLPYHQALAQCKMWLRGQTPDGLVNGSAVASFLQARMPDTLDAITSDKCYEAARELELSHPTSPPFDDPVYWAPYCIQGVLSP